MPLREEKKQTAPKCYCVLCTLCANLYSTVLTRVLIQNITTRFSFMENHPNVCEYSTGVWGNKILFKNSYKRDYRNSANLWDFSHNANIRRPNVSRHRF